MYETAWRKCTCAVRQGPQAMFSASRTVRRTTNNESNTHLFFAGSIFSLTSAPVMFHLEQEKDAELLTEINKGTESVTNIDYKKVYDIVTKGKGVFAPI